MWSGLGLIPGATRQAGRIPNPGNPIAVVHEERIKCAAFYLRYRLVISRVILMLDITIKNSRAIRDFKSQIDENVNPGSEKAPKLSPNIVLEFFYKFADYLQEHIGSVSKRPLGYVVMVLELFFILYFWWQERDFQC